MTMLSIQKQNIISIYCNICLSLHYQNNASMIRNIILILILSTRLVNAQVLFSEDFNSLVMPVNFTTYDMDGLTTSPMITGVCPFTGSFIICQYNGETFAASPSLFTIAGTADDWMVTPAINLPNNATTKTLEFDARSGDAAWLDGVEIYVSTTGNSPADFLTSAALYNSTSTGEPSTWTTRNVDISAYSGQIIYIGFRHNNYNKFILGIDNIKVIELSDNDAELTSLDFPEYTTVPAVIDIEGTIKNLGGSDITSMDITWTDGTNSYTDNLSGLNISSLTSYNFIHTTQLNLVNPGSQTIEVTINNINGGIDPNMNNNALSLTINTVPFIPTKRVVFEEAGGTWCPWCPQGIVAMETIEQNYPLTAIPIAVHNGDIMTNTLYDASLDMANYPSARIDRKIIASGSPEVNATAFMQYYADRINVFSPVELEADAIFSPSTRQITITLRGEFVIDLAGDYRFNAVILEDNVGPYNQYNNFGGFQPPVIAPLSGTNFSTSPNPVSITFDHVARAILGGYDGISGSLPANISEGGTYTYEYTHSLPSNQNENNIKIVGMVIDFNTGEILNGIKVDLDQTTNTDEIYNKSNINVFPNPTKNILHIDGEYSSIKIYNILGELVLTTKSKKTIDISKLSNGIFNIHVLTDQGTIVKKITTSK